MRKLILFMHTSLDGFVAGPNGEMDWIDTDETIFDYSAQRTSEADAALYGRVTYEMMQSYWPTAGEQPNATKHDINHSRWYNSVDKIVLSKTTKEVLPKTKIIADDLVDEIVELKQASGKDILMFGSPTAAHSLMAENLIDAYWIFINPVLLGHGKPLFDSLKDVTNLTLLTSKTFKSGVIGLHYETKRS